MKSHEFKGGFFERIATARALNSMTQVELAKLAGVSQRQIAAYEAAQSFPRPGVLHRLAEALGTTPEWLASGAGEGKIKARVSPAMVTIKVPIITMDNVIDFLSNGYRGDVLTSKFHATSCDVSKASFAIINQDEAMAYSDPDGYGFPLGSIVVFDPMIEAEHLDFVCALNEDFRTTFRQLFVGDSAFVLSPLDRRYPQEQVKNEKRKETFLIPAVSVEIHLPAANRD